MALNVKIDISDSDWEEFKDNCKAQGRTLQASIGFLIVESNIRWKEAIRLQDTKFATTEQKAAIHRQNQKNKGD